MLDELKKKVSRFPDLPGVYLLKDKNDRVIYVGKALALRQRVRSYLAENINTVLSPRLRSLQSRLADIDYLVTDTEVEALILECSLIKEYRPRYNVNLKDDKDFPYLILTADLYPRLELLRLSQKGGKRLRYKPHPDREELRFGPYTDVGAVKETMRLLNSIFSLRRCRQPLDGAPTGERPCLNHQMKRCLAPCLGVDEVTPEDYEKLVKQVVLFLRGRYSELEEKLLRDMDKAAREERFETAAALRDRLQSLQRVAGQQQKMLDLASNVNRDVLALERFNNRAAVQLFQIRDGKLLRQNHFPLVGAEEVDDAEVMASFIKNFYNRQEDLPPEIVVSELPVEDELLTEWLQSKAGRKVKLRFPRRGSLKKLVALAQRNCLLRLQDDEEQRRRSSEEPLKDLALLLNLEEGPQRIEGYDISHLQGVETVGAMVVFLNGEPGRQDYRRFNVRAAAKSDDYAALQEVLERRAAQKEWPRPDLILIDGGRGQLNAAIEALHGTSLQDVPLLALAKNPDHIFIAGAAQALRPAANNNMLRLLQRIRDEVHRFAVSGHRSRREKSATRSRLENIPGIGPAKRKALLAHFGSIENIRKAGLESLAEVKGITPSLALLINNELKEEKQ